jgi:peroxiredoxin Q/BCP
VKKAPHFSLADQDGNYHTLSDYLGRWVVLHFYPKDDTPGCTTEACNFRDARDAIAEFCNAVVIGVSKDTVKSHKKFADKYNLNFTLLSDPTHEVIDAYGAWQEKSMFGKKYMGIQRMTLIIDPSGTIAKEYPKVNPAKHAVEIIADLRSLQAHHTQ